MSKVWLVTGSSRGLGRAIVEGAVAAGDRVLATARDVTALGGLAAGHADQVRTYTLDVTDEVAAQSAVNAAIKTFGRLDVVVNNAGYGNIKPIEDTSVREFREELETNLFGTIIVTKAALPHFRAAGSGHFIQFSSVGGRIGPPGRGPYPLQNGVSKAFPRCFPEKSAR